MTAPTTAPRPGPGPTAERNGVTVAVDGTDTGLRAVRWAADEASARGGSLALVHAAPYAAGSAGSLRAHASRILARAYTVARRHAPQVPAHTVLLDQDPLGALVEISRQTSRLGGLLVVGRTGTGHASDALVGSLAVHVVSRAQGPVVVVGPLAGAPGGPVVAAVGDPVTDLGVLTQAHRAAARHGVRLEVVHAARNASEGAEARDGLERVLRTLDLAEPGVTVSVEVARERPYEAVVEYSRSAGLLVIGAGRGHRHLLGSTTRTAIRFAGCPVLVAVPEPETPDEER
ncbi:universal stress protein [Pseudonocardia sp. RS11V-5]|uniref:universal stress protein n=1 Tax=Pseudonocardia terrae TaxID=2905831 RepID=UPI001E4D3956|nr:universal stress protein [Pseudonocardia terrae]MCE3553155.1 universal stress protein [Pseudonocardia terrae]